MLNLKQDFPQLQEQVNNQRLVYLDSAATSLKPKRVVEAISHFDMYEAANVHRGAHYFSDRATSKFEGARQKVASFLNADASEIVFTRGTTESINLVAESLSKFYFKSGDRILITRMEHHSNIVPWQLIAEEKGLQIDVVELLPTGEIDLASLEMHLKNRPKLLAITACSNALGVVNPIQKITEMAHKAGAIVLVDGAQSVTFESTDVKEIGCDFFVFSAHKMFGPFGLGVLFGKKEWLAKMPPYQGGGSMISKVTFKKTTFLDAPQKFEAGTPAISEVIGLGEAIDYVRSIGYQKIQDHKYEILAIALGELQEIEGIKIYGDSRMRTSIVSFNIEGAHASDVGQLLDKQGVAVRAGHHCAQPLMEWLKVTGTIRASFSIYNTAEDVTSLKNALLKAREMLL